jgi:hypothetical protein
MWITILLALLFVGAAIVAVYFAMAYYNKNQCVLVTQPPVLCTTCPSYTYPQYMKQMNTNNAMALWNTLNDKKAGLVGVNAPTVPPNVAAGVGQYLIQSTRTPAWLENQWGEVKDFMNTYVIPTILRTQQYYIQTSTIPALKSELKDMYGNPSCSITSAADSWTPITCDSPTSCTLNVNAGTGNPVKHLYIPYNVSIHKVSAHELNTNVYENVHCETTGNDDAN